MESTTARKIQVFHSFYDVEAGGLLCDDYQDDEYLCEPDEWDLEEGTTPVDMAVEVLKHKLYLEEASSYPDWQRSTWYSRSEDLMETLSNGATRKDVAAHLVNFTDAESLEIFKRFTAR